MSKAEFSIPPKNRVAALRAMCRELVQASPDRWLKVKVAVHKEDRSAAQNRALFGVAYAIISDVTGNDKDDLHFYFCCSFFGTTHVNVFGKSVPRPVRTTTTDENGAYDLINTAQFCEFYALVQRESADMDIYVPDPDPRLRRK